MSATVGFLQQRLEITEHVRVARDTYRLRFAAAEMAARARPGQFFMVRLPGTTDPLLGRAFALYDTVLGPDGQPIGFDILYQVVGKMTGRLVAVPVGAALDVWGPLGNGFRDPPVPAACVALVAGGVGQAPFVAYARYLLGGRGYGTAPAHRRAERVVVCYGTRSADLLAGLEDFEQIGAELQLATDDGSRGHHGYVTDLFARLERPDSAAACGPEPMMHALARLAAERGVPCQVSLEAPMACGVGICFSCVTRVRQGDGWDYRRSCVEGPVFDAAELLW